MTKKYLNKQQQTEAIFQIDHALANTAMIAQLLLEYLELEPYEDENKVWKLRKKSTEPTVS